MKILLIEDDAIIGDAIKSSLEKTDYLVEWAKNGLEGEIALTDSQFEAVILDLGLHKKHGLDILKNLRSKKNQFPVLIISANENIDNKILGLDLGADDYLAKPFELQELPNIQVCYPQKCCAEHISEHLINETCFEEQQNRLNNGNDIFN